MLLRLCLLALRVSAADAPPEVVADWAAQDGLADVAEVDVAAHEAGRRELLAPSALTACIPEQSTGVPRLYSATIPASLSDRDMHPHGFRPPPDPALMGRDVQPTADP